MVSNSLVGTILHFGVPNHTKARVDFEFGLSTQQLVHHNIENKTTTITAYLHIQSTLVL